jgi:large subunit ribosomal protein L25
MSEIRELKASLRPRVGKGSARAARREGLIPCVIYGEKQPPLSIVLDWRTVNRQFQTGHFLTSLFDIEVEGEKTRVIPRDVQVDPVRDFPMHVDFLRLSRDSKIAVEIPVHFINEEASPGLKRGGVLNVVRYEVELECPVDSIPDEIVIDLTGLDLGDSLHISSVTLPEGVTPTITDRDFTIATIAAPAGMPSDEEEEGEEEGEGEEGEEGEEASDATEE